MAVSKRLRHEVMRRDSHTCRYCGGTAPDVRLTIDHVTPVTLGGSDEPSNLVTACADCNAGKSATPPDAALVADVDQRAVEWGQAMQVAIERRTAEFTAQRGRTDRFDAAWKRWGNGGREMPRDAGWRSSVLGFLAAGLTDEFIEDAVELAMGKTALRNGDIWRYFCGICWREVDKIQKMALAITAPGQPTKRHRVEEIDEDGLSADDIRMIDDHNRQLQATTATADALDIIVDRLARMVSPRDEKLLTAVARVKFESCAAAERFYDFGVGTQEKVDTATTQLTAFVDEALAREQVHCPPRFDDMNAFDAFAEDLTRALGGSDEVIKFVHHLLWSAMPDAYGEWKRLLNEPEDDFRADDEDEELNDYANGRARDYFESCCANGMYEISEWRKAQHGDATYAAAESGARQ